MPTLSQQTGIRPESRRGCRDMPYLQNGGVSSGSKSMAADAGCQAARRSAPGTHWAEQKRKGQEGRELLARVEVASKHRAQEEELQRRLRLQDQQLRQEKIPSPRESEPTPQQSEQKEFLTYDAQRKTASPTGTPQLLGIIGSIAALYRCISASRRHSGRAKPELLPERQGRWNDDSDSGPGFVFPCAHQGLPVALAYGSWKPWRHVICVRRCPQKNVSSRNTIGRQPFPGCD